MKNLSFLTIMQTGDTVQLTPYICLAAASVILIVLFVIYKRKKGDKQ